MTLNEMAVDQLGLISHVDVQKSQEETFYRLISMGIVGGLEIRKLSKVATCAEYRVEGTAARIVISKELADFIYVDLLDETV